MPRAGTALTGRADILEVAPLTQVEMDGGTAAFVPDLLREALPERPVGHPVTERAEYVRRVVSGGMPVAVRRPPGPSRERWFANYVDLVIERDVLELSRVRQRAVLPRLLRVLAARAGQVLNVRNVAQTVQVEPSTAENYLRLLEAVFLVRRLPAWGTTLGSRVGRQPKVHCVDPGLAAFLLGLTPGKIATNDPSVLTEFGHVVETFVVSEVIAQASWFEGPVSVGHYRTAGGDEVDLVLERGDGQVFAFEVKAGSRLHEADLRGLRALRRRLGPRLSAAVVLHTGPHAFTFEDGIAALPLDSLWTASTA